MTILRPILCVAILTASVFLASTGFAAPILFDLRGVSGLDLDGLASGSTTAGGVTATISANDGLLNQTGSGFGINAVGAGDDTDAVDDGSGVTEVVTISFDTLVTLDQLQLSLLSAGEEGSLVIAGGSPISLTDTGSGDDEFNFAMDNLVPVGQSIVLSHVLGNGFSFDDFTVNPVAAAVPEPASLALLLWGSVLLTIGRGTRRRRGTLSRKALA